MRMVGDIDGVLIGKTWAEVVELLGPPDSAASDRWLVVHGNGLGFCEWREWLVVRVDRDTGRVSEVTLFD